MLLQSAKQLEAASYDRFPKNKFFIHSFLKNDFPFFFFNQPVYIFFKKE